MRIFVILMLLAPSFLFSQKYSHKHINVVDERQNTIKLFSPVEVDDNNHYKLSFKDGVATLSDGLDMIKKILVEGRKIDVYGGGGDDLLEVDLRGVSHINVYYDGQNNFKGTEGDILELIIPDHGSLEIDYFNKTDGKIYVGDNTVEFAGLEPISNTGTASDIVFNLPSVNQTVTLGDDAVMNDGVSVLESTMAEITFFNNPTNSLILNGGTGDDIINFNGLDASGATPSITINGGGGTNTLIVDAKGTAPSDNGSMITVPGFFTINYSNFSSVSFINAISELSISATTQAAEDVTNGLFTISTSLQFGTNTEVSFTVTGDATEGVDFSNLGTTFIFPANTDDVTITVPVIADDLDEMDESVTLTLTGTDNANVTIGIPSMATVTIQDNDETPVITAGQVFSVNEEAPNSFSVGSVLATDTDAGTTFQNWMIVGGNMDGIFGINPSTGQITVVNNTNLDRESIASYTLSVTVSDGTNTSQPEDVVININDVNDELPVITPGQEFQIMMANANNGDPVGVVVAMDPDITPTTFQDWMIISGNDDSDGDLMPPFAIDPLTGEIAINDENELSGFSPMYQLEVTVSDGVNTSMPEIVTIILLDFPIPTLSEWGLLILSISLLILGVSYLKRSDKSRLYIKEV